VDDGLVQLLMTADHREQMYELHTYLVTYL